jgi:hypothetical protein
LKVEKIGFLMHKATHGVVNFYSACIVNRGRRIGSWHNLGRLVTDTFVASYESLDYNNTYICICKQNRKT